jgi:hypothetical protein
MTLKRLNGQNMLLLVTWTLFWRAYGLVVVCLISIPIRRSIRDNQEWAVSRAAPVETSSALEKEPSPRFTGGARVEEQCAFPPFLRIWEAESPPIIKAGTNWSSVKKRDARDGFQEKEQEASAKDLDRLTRKGKAAGPIRKRRKCTKAKVRRKKRPAISAAYKEKINNQSRLFRKGLRQAAKDMAVCINEVADHTTTVRELRQTLRLVIRQHPGLKDLPYPQAVQELLWLDNRAAPLAMVGEKED